MFKATQYPMGVSFIISSHSNNISPFVCPKPAVNLFVSAVTGNGKTLSPFLLPFKFYKSKFASCPLNSSSFFLQKSRYGIYAMLTRAKLKTGSDDLAALEAALFDAAASAEDGLKKSQSSPSLNQEAASTGPRIKRNSRPAATSLQKS